jgi:putative DNA primase/helicase
MAETVKQRFPSEILDSDRAVVWKLALREAHWTKIPYRVRDPRSPADVTDPTTWGAFQDARLVVMAGQADGQGIVLGDGLTGIDLDHCRDRSGFIAPEARRVIALLDSYTEMTPSGTGVHVLARGILPPGRRRKEGIELYDRDRFFTVTGDHLIGTPLTINERTHELARLHAQAFPAPRVPCASRSDCAPSREDDAVIVKATSARNGGKFRRLYAGETTGYASQSEADLALCRLLDYWTGGDPAQIDRLFRRSGLMRAKWDERRGNATYGEHTIRSARA